MKCCKCKCAKDHRNIVCCRDSAFYKNSCCIGKNTKKGQVSKLDLWNRFYRCRDIELGHLWQRSVFLGAFLLLCFTGYGYIFSKYCDATKNVTILHCAGFFVSIIGIVLGVIWIYMGKASKRWFEVYEHVIWDLEKDADLNIPEHYQMGNYPRQEEFDNSCLSFKAGKYSPSKLNILIGVLSLFIWLVTAAFHLCKLKVFLQAWLIIFFYEYLGCFSLVLLIAYLIKCFIGKLTASSFN